MAYLRILYPVRCPHCRTQLTSRRRLWKHEPWWGMRWCRQCRCIVRYVWPEDEDY